MRAALFVLLIVGLAACNSAANTPNPPTDTPVPPTNTPSIVSFSDGGDTPATEPAPQNNSVAGSETIDCGEVILKGNPAHAVSADSVKAASACFLKAMSACQAATLTVRGPDEGLTRQFSIESAAKCIIHQALQPDPNSAPAVVDCESVTQQGDGILFSNCSHLGDFSIAP